jgi:hypothetical protein
MRSASLRSSKLLLERGVATPAELTSSGKSNGQGRLASTSILESSSAISVRATQCLVVFSDQRPAQQDLAVNALRFTNLTL